MNNYEGLDDSRDRIAFVEYYPERGYCLTSVWRENGTLDYYVAGRIYETEDA